MLSSLPFAPGGPHGVDPLILLVMALLAEAIFGGFPILFRLLRHPRDLAEGGAAWLDRKLNREQRSERTRAWRGVLALIAVVAVSIVLGLAVGWLARNHPFGWIVEFPLVVTLLGQRQAYERAREVARALDDHLEAARRALERMGEPNAAALDFSGVARAALERLARSFTVDVAASVAGYVLFGLAGLAAVRAVAALAERIGHPTPRHRAFGRAARTADAAINFVPARFAGLFLVLAAPLARGARASFSGALKSMLRHAPHYRLPNLGWPVAAMAGALGIERDTARATARDLRRGVKLYVAACALHAAFVGLLALAR
ncbi:MAG: cobalamin biosynthesis protein [Acidimicrobiia bacterium]|nr:cobalamin biosynthesis protein [Acidimicrobiia bacterium]